LVIVFTELQGESTRPQELPTFITALHLTFWPGQLLLSCPMAQIHGDFGTGIPPLFGKAATVPADGMLGRFIIHKPYVSIPRLVYLVNCSIQVWNSIILT
jgi:hypothetical protein